MDGEKVQLLLLLLSNVETEVPSMYATRQK